MVLKHLPQNYLIPSLYKSRKVKIYAEPFDLLFRTSDNKRVEELLND